MAKDPSEVKDRTRAGGEVTLRDESDEIVDNLKARLTSLQSQLDAYKNADSRPQAAGGGGNEDLVSAWNAAVTPHLASRLQLPAEELTHRLDRLIEQAADPELREDLERCRELAFFFYETFQKISSNHRLLTESLTAPSTEVDMADFCRLLEHPLARQSTPVPVKRRAGTPRRMTFASPSAATVARSLAELAATLFGKDLRIEVGHLPAGADGERGHRLTLRVFSEGEGAEAEAGEEVSVFAMRRGITANTVVDLLYVEKIIELQGGSFAFDRREGRVHGFEVQLPCELQEGP